MPSPVERLLSAIGYPEKAPAGASSFSVLVDGGEVLVRAEPGRLFFSRALACGREDLPRLASFVPGRMLREEAVLAADPGPDGAAFLWRDLPDDASAAAMQRAFESFCDSCDWWLDRISEFSAPEPEIPPLMIRP
jgi:hypothetical protein